MKVSGEAQTPETIDRLKDLLISPLGAIGDRLFWATIKPASLITGMVGILLAPTIFATKEFSWVTATVWMFINT